MAVAAIAKLDTATLAFIEEFGLLISEASLPRSVGRVLGLLLICQPIYQSAEEIQRKLQLSVGSVSTATSLLEKMELVQRVTFPGDRRLYYQIDPDCLQKLINLRLQQVRRAIRILDRGLVISHDDSRMLSVRKVYTEFDRLMSQLKLT